jgi:archaemetzincin
MRRAVVARVVLAAALVIAAAEVVWLATRDRAAPEASGDAAAVADAPGAAPAASARAPAGAVASFTVCLQPLGEHDASLLAPIARGITQAYGFDVRQLAPRTLPEFAWYPPRNRHRAPALLDYLLYDVMPAAPGCHAVVGVTSVDVSATKGEHFDWGVLGLAYHGGRVAVVSSHRLHRGVDRRGLVVRAVKVALHELGHVIGVLHRDDGPDCLMNDAVGAVATIDRAEGPMCAPERAVAERFLGRELPGRETLDWEAILLEEQQ